LPPEAASGALSQAVSERTATNPIHNSARL
jgi:hypothetical protein